MPTRAAKLETAAKEMTRKFMHLVLFELVRRIPLDEVHPNMRCFSLFPSRCVFTKALCLSEPDGVVLHSWTSSKRVSEAL